MSHDSRKPQHNKDLFIPVGLDETLFEEVK
jgi:hypothetical protein